MDAQKIQDTCTSILQGKQFDVFVPAIGPVILQTDIAVSRMCFVRNIKLVNRSIRTSVFLRPLIQIHLRYVAAIDRYRNMRSFTSQYQVVP